MSEPAEWPDCKTCGRNLDHGKPCQCHTCCPPEDVGGIVRDARWWQVYCVAINACLIGAGEDVFAEPDWPEGIAGDAVRVADAACRVACGKGET